jgi:PBSX family phage portal protein
VLGWQQKRDLEKMEDNESIAKIDNLDRSEKKEKSDPFSTSVELVKSYDGMTHNFKRKAARVVSKAFTGVDDTKSKQLFPEQDMVTAYGLFDVVIPPYNLDELAYFYENSFANHAAIGAKVSNIVGLGYGFEMTDMTIARLEEAPNDDSLMRAQRKIQRTKAALTDWLESLNDEDTFTHVLEKVYTDVETVGNGYIEVGRKVNGDIGYIGHIPATTIRVRRMRDGYIQIVNQKVVYFRNFQETKNINPVTSDNRPNELIHIKKYSPKNSYYGVPDTVAAATSMVGNELAAKYNVDYFENKAVPRYIATLKGAKLSSDAEDKFFRFMQAGLKGQNHRTLYIPLPGDGPDNKVEFKLDPIENGIQDGSFEKYRKSNRDDILMAHQVPYSKVGGGAGVSIASALVADRTFKEQVARPSQRNLEKTINKIVKEKTDMVVLKFNELTLTDEQTQSQIDERYLRMQVLVPNEVRERLGYPVRPGGSEPIVMGAQARAEQTAQSTGNRLRDQQRTNNASDSASTDTGRNPQGEGRVQE